LLRTDVKRTEVLCMPVWFLAAIGLLSLATPGMTGRLVDAGGHRLHINCTGRGQPTVVIETGLGDFSFDWILSGDSGWR
jgi:hypothetical protein